MKKEEEKLITYIPQFSSRPLNEIRCAVPATVRHLINIVIESNRGVQLMKACWIQCTVGGCSDGVGVGVRERGGPQSWAEAKRSDSVPIVLLFDLFIGETSTSLSRSRWLHGAKPLSPYDPSPRLFFFFYHFLLFLLLFFFFFFFTFFLK